MYGYDEYADITPEQLLQKISQEEIFEWILGVPFDINKKYLAPYRDDKTPKCWFEKRDGILLFMDWGDREGKRHKSCFAVIMAVYRVSLQSAVDIVCQNFGLSKSSADYKPADKIQYERQDKLPAIITPEHQPYNKRDKLHWSKYLITVDNLKEDNVFSTKRFFLDSAKGRRWITPYSHCYDMDFLDAHKIYQPYQTTYKWITNCNEDHIGNIDNLPANGELLIVEKAYDDHRSLRNLFPELNVIWLQNEGCVPSMHILENLSSRFRLILIFFDNDEAGVIAALKLTSIFNSIRDNSTRTVCLPLGPKNVSDLVNKEGRSDSMKILNKIL